MNPVCPNTISAGCPLTVGIDFHSSTRLLAVSATTRICPSDAIAVGKCMLDAVTGTVGVVVVVSKSGCPTTTVAVPPHTGQRPLSGGISAVAAGIIWLMFG